MNLVVHPSNLSTWLAEDHAELEASLGYKMRLSLKKLQKEKEAGKMAQCIRVVAVLAEQPGFSPQIQPGSTEVSSGLPVHCGTRVHTRNNGKILKKR